MEFSKDEMQFVVSVLRQEIVEADKVLLNSSNVIVLSAYKGHKEKVRNLIDKIEKGGE